MLVTHGDPIAIEAAQGSMPLPRQLRLGDTCGEVRGLLVFFDSVVQTTNHSQ